MTGPLDGIRVIELAAKGPAPFGAMLLSDFGADVVRIDRSGARPHSDPLGRGRRSIAIDLKSERGVEVLLRLVESADVLIEGYRPGVAERLGFGPATCQAVNPRLVFARMTGWGQSGPLANQAGHDLNFLAATGALFHLGGRDETPSPPLNLVGDFGGGAMYLFAGVLLALIERERSGCGQVVDAAMVDGVASLTTAYHALRAVGQWSDTRESNLVDGGAPSYRTYRCADSRFVAVGCLEPATYRSFLDLLGLDPADWPQHDTTRWPTQRTELGAIFAARDRGHWESLFAGSDACVTAVLDLGEAVKDSHLVERETFSQVDGVVLPNPAPRLSRTPGRIGRTSTDPGADTDEILAELGFSATQLARLRADAVVS